LRIAKILAEILLILKSIFKLRGTQIQGSSEADFVWFGTWIE